MLELCRVATEEDEVNASVTTFAEILKIYFVKSAKNLTILQILTFYSLNLFQNLTIYFAKYAETLTFFFPHRTKKPCLPMQDKYCANRRQRARSLLRCSLYSLPSVAKLCRNDQNRNRTYQCTTDAEPSVSAVLARALPRREPMEQREESQARLGYPESRQRKAKPTRKAIANIHFTYVRKPDRLEPPSVEADSPIFLSSTLTESF